MNAIEKKSLAVQLAEHLLKEIQSGTYSLGEKLPSEPALMKLFGVGRSSVREAIRILSNRGTLEVKQGVGTFVSSLQSDEPWDHKMSRAGFSELREVRQLLETKIAEKAALHRSEKDLLEMQQCLKDRKAHALQGNIKACIEADIRFHNGVAAACGNPILTDIYRSASVHISKWFIEQYPDTLKFIATHSLHRKLFKYIQLQQPKKAAITAKQIVGDI